MLNIYFYLKRRFNRKEGKTDKVLYLLVHTQMVKIVRAKLIRGQSFFWISMWVQGSKDLDHSLLFSQAKSSKLDRKWNSQKMYQPLNFIFKAFPLLLSIFVMEQWATTQALKANNQNLNTVFTSFISVWPHIVIQPLLFRLFYLSVNVNDNWDQSMKLHMWSP